MSEPHPNVLVIFADQLRRDALSIYGDANITTPNIDALAQQGVRFRNACSTYPICVPFRFTLMTGQYAHTRGVPGIGFRMSPAERTLADEFNDAGYQTMYVGKWHLHGGRMNIGGYSAKGENRPVPRADQGRWQHWRGFELRNGHFDTSYFVDDDPTPVPIEGYQTDGLFDVTMDLLKQRKKDQPFCCVLSIEPPHPPYEAPQELMDKWLAKEISLPPNFMVPDDKDASADGPTHSLDATKLGAEKIIYQRQVYYAMIENFDRNVGRMMAYLKEQGLLDNTIVVLMADHGELGGSHALRNKQYPYEESVGIPLMVRGPGVPAARVLDEPTCTEDLYPTLLGLAGITPKQCVPGDNLAPLVKGNTQMLNRPGVMLEFVSDVRPGSPFHKETWRAFRSQRYKYITVGDYHGATPWRFYDLQQDPYELNNLLDDPAHAELVAQHHRWLRDRLIETNDDYPLAAAFGCEAWSVTATPKQQKV